MNRRYPKEVVATLPDLMRFEYYTQRVPFYFRMPIQSMLTGPHASRLRGRGMDFEEVRLYLPGDDIRYIDWRVTARTGKTYSKLFNEEKQRPVFLIVDQGGRMFTGTTLYMKSVMAAHIAALVAFYVTKGGDRIGGIVFNDTDKKIMKPLRSIMHLQYLLVVMADMNALLPAAEERIFDASRLNSALHHTKATISDGHLIILISDFLNADQETFQGISALGATNDIIAVHIADPLDETLPDGKLMLSDDYQQLLWDNKFRQNGERYEENYRTMISKIQEQMEHSGASFGIFSTAEALESQLKKAFSVQN